MASFNVVPIIDVHKKNFISLWPTLISAIHSASFIAIDLELSGLGSRKALRSKNVDDRYKVIAEVAKTRSIISLGISCFKLQNASMNGCSSENIPKLPSESDNLDKNSSTTSLKWQFLVQTFNILTLCSEDYTVEPEALKFLVSHGFDFNKQYILGVPYYRGKDKEEDDEEEGPSLRKVFNELILSKNSIVFHNALVDLIFLYQNLYAELPPTLNTFTADLTEIFPAGIYDTKYIAEYISHTTASYLEYIFRKFQRENLEKSQKKKPYVVLQFLKYKPNLDCIEYKDLRIDTSGLETIPRSKICIRFANHGYCPQAETCSLSHNVDCVLDMENKSKKKRNKRNKSEKKSKKTNDEMDEDINESNLVNSYGIRKSSSIEKNSILEDCLDTELCHTTISQKQEKGSPQTPPGNQDNGMDCKESSNEVNKCGENANSSISMDASGESSEVSRLCRKSSGHRAGCDAFMTGFTMAAFFATYGKFPDPKSFSASDTQFEELVNRVYLSGKAVPLLLFKSTFAKSSKCHQVKLKKLADMSLEVD